MRNGCSVVSMTNTKKAVAVISTIALALALSGCAVTTGAKSGPGQTEAKYVETPEGQVLCVFWVPVSAAGVASAEGAQISCDWAGAK